MNLEQNDNKVISLAAVLKKMNISVSGSDCVSVSFTVSVTVTVSVLVVASVLVLVFLVVCVTCVKPRRS